MEGFEEEEGALVSSRRKCDDSGGWEEVCGDAVEVYARRADEGRVVEGRDKVVVVGRDEAVRRRHCCEEDREEDLSLRGILPCLAVLLYVPAELEVMRSRHLDAEVAVRFIAASYLSSLLLFLILLYPLHISRKYRDNRLSVRSEIWLRCCSRCAGEICSRGDKAIFLGHLMTSTLIAEVALALTL